ncbi:hypothetical protein [Sulfurivirga sp.]|uniref:hypothetical protein n=1 Tax=Sulfurivirga sp. TaxID=2614236 RepID=UPI0025F3476E|nr:hypothetical protein [Sulfurivirga sp.]
MLKKIFAAGMGLMLLAGQVWAEELKPFVLSTLKPASVTAGVEAAKKALTGAGFTVVGEYDPKGETHIIVVTSDALKQIAAQSDNGGFGAMERVAVVKHKGNVEVSYTNPAYWWNAYRMKGDIAPVAAAMKKALGDAGQYGAEPGLSAGDLRDYHYKFMMPYFTDVDELEEYDSHQQGIDTIEKSLAKRVEGVSKVYRIDIPGTEMTVWGVAFTREGASDKHVLDNLDQGAHSHAAHLPYEILLNGKKAVALNGKFRIAISWPRLPMGTFMNIMSTPDDILSQLEDVADPDAD